MTIDAIKPITPHYNSGNRKAYKEPPQDRVFEATAQSEALKRYAALSQLLFDALVPFVSSYERHHDCAFDAQMPDDYTKHIAVSLADIRRAQAVIRMNATDIYA